MTDYAEDLRAVVRYLTDKRKDVDENRIAVAGHSEGAAIAMLAAQRDKNIRALVLMAGPGTTGAELILEQQAHALSRLNLPEEERAKRIGLQLKIQAAALSGQGWDGIPPELQRQANTPWFASLLQYDPAAVMKKVNQPILIVQGDLDRQVPTAHADKLATLAKARKKARRRAGGEVPDAESPARAGEDGRGRRIREARNENRGARSLREDRRMARRHARAEDVKAQPSHFSHVSGLASHVYRSTPSDRPGALS